MPTAFNNNPISHELPPEVIEYLSKLGFSQETLLNYHFSYDNEKKTVHIPGFENIEVWNLDGAPTPNHSPDVWKNNPPFFNESVLENTTPVFITSTILDALSILQVGFPAVSINGINNSDRLLFLVHNKRVQAPLILFFGFDEKECEASQNLFWDLVKEGHKVICYPTHLYGKTANELLRSDFNTFSCCLTERTAAVLAQGSVKHLVEFDLKRQLTERQERIPTGFAELDQQIGGGFCEGIHVISGPPGAGKTTFAMNIAANIVEDGTDVLFFSCELNTIQLLTKIAKRAAFLKDDKNSTLSHADLTYAEIVNNLSEATLNHLYLFDDVKKASNMTDIVASFSRWKTNKKVIFIDYLQFLEPSEKSRYTDERQEIIDSLSDFYKLAHKYHVPVVILSSVSKADYKGSGSLSSGKEAGEIQFVADSLYYLTLPDKNDDTIPYRKTQLNAFKNRSGTYTFSVPFNYFAANDCFLEPSKTKQNNKEEVVHA